MREDVQRALAIDDAVAPCDEDDKLSVDELMAKYVGPDEDDLPANDEFAEKGNVNNGHDVVRLDEYGIPEVIDIVGDDDSSEEDYINEGIGSEDNVPNIIDDDLSDIPDDDIPSLDDILPDVPISEANDILDEEDLPGGATYDTQIDCDRSIRHRIRPPLLHRQPGRWLLDGNGLEHRSSQGIPFPPFG